MANENHNLHSAKRNKKDEFYTQLVDIEMELRHYRDHFRGKVVYCNCDDPYVSAFFEYFAKNFEFLGLKKLITTCYKSQWVDLFSQNDSEHAIKLEYTGGAPNNMPTADDIGVTALKGDGDFRSPECIALLQEADIVCTNPPFSLFREYVEQLAKYDKQFLIIGNKNAITYKETFKLIKDELLWLGITSPRDFTTPTGELSGKLAGLTRWFTNLGHAKRRESLTLWQTYTPEQYPKYDNYDAINADKVADIPKDYDGAMGVPITFLDKHNPEQFEILGFTSGRDEFEARPTKRYINPIQLNADGSQTNGSKANTRSTILSAERPLGTCYIADNVQGYLSILYARIIIQRRK